jgi:hypothetical protein
METPHYLEQIIWDDGLRRYLLLTIISEDYDGTDINGLFILVTTQLLSIPSGTTVTLYSHLTVASGGTFTPKQC